MDLQHDGVVLWWRVSTAGLRLRAVGREREVEGSRTAARVGVVGVGVLPYTPYIGGWPAPLTPPPSPRVAAPRVEWGASLPPSRRFP